MKCTQCGIYEIVAFKNARTMVFSKSGGACKSFRLGPKNHNFFLGGVALAHIYLHQKARMGRFNNYHVILLRGIVLFHVHNFLLYISKRGVTKWVDINVC